ncbi:protein kinase [Candidatus Sumerlaeota bacterium]|nr:protein kinase [Candidatus Sumerlaeota bacterium]
MTDSIPHSPKPGDFKPPVDPSQSIAYGPGETVRSSAPESLNFSIWNLEGLGLKTPLPLNKPLPSFELVHLVAKGGCGEIWQARQKSLERVVAVKKIEESLRKEASASKIMRWRVENEFRVEALATARLDHPGIVPVYDFGVDAEGWPLMAMKLVNGDPWQDLLRRDFSTMPVHDYLARHLPIFVSVMHAVAFAHSRGIVHRDLKPAQVMVGEFGEVLLTDWGFALFVGSPDSATEGDNDLGDQLPTPQTANNPSGTPFFMAPEQTPITANGITPLTDIYLLGGTLYFLLTNDFPHRAITSEKAMELAAKGYVTPFEEAAPSRQIPPELERIALHALAANPADRIQSVTEFIEEIGNYLSGATSRRESQKLVNDARSSLASVFAAQRAAKRIEASYQDYVEGLANLNRAGGLWPENPEIKPLREKLLEEYTREALRNDDLNLAHSHVGIIEDDELRASLEAEIRNRTDQLRRQSLQRRIAIGLVGVLFAALIVSGAAYIRSQRINQLRIEQERDQAEDARVRAQDFREQAEAARADAEKQQKLAEDAREIAENEQYFANISLASSSLEQDRVVMANDALMNKTPADLRNWEWGRLLAETQGEAASIGLDGTTDACFSPDGQLVYTGDREGRLCIWSMKDGRLIKQYHVHNGRIWDVALTPDGKYSFTSSFDTNAAMFDLEKGEIVRRYEGHTDILRGLAVSRDGKHLLTTSQDQTARVWDVESGKCLITLTNFEDVVYHGDFNHDGTQFVTACRDGTVRVWDTQTGSLVLDLKGQQESALSACFSDDGTRILSAGTDRYARIHDAKTGNLLREFHNPTAYIHAATFNHQGNYIATAADDGVARLWDAETGREIAHFVADSPMWKISFSPDDKSIVTCSAHSVRIWSVNRLVFQPQFKPISPQSPDWKTPTDTIRIYGLSRGRDTTWREREKRWNVPEGRTLVTLPGREIAIDSHFVAFAPDGSTRIDIDPATYFGKVSDARTGKLIKEFERKQLSAAIYSPDGKTAAVVQPIDRIELFDTATWESRGFLQMDPKRKIKVAIQLYIVASLTFSHDSRQLLVPYLNDKVVLWDLQTRKPVYESEKTAGLGPCVTYNPAGDLFAISGNDDRITLWDAKTGTIIRSFVGHTRPVSEIDFCPDGDRLVSYARDNTVKLWEVKSGREIMTIYTADANDTILAAYFTHDGRDIFIVTANGIVKVFDTFPWKLDDYPLPGAPLQERLEKYKRDHCLPSLAGE